MKSQARLQALLGDIYSSETARLLAERISKRVSEVSVQIADRALWCESDVLLITYADSFSEENQPPLLSLKQFLRDYAPGLFSQVHLLPFYPYTSDDGFAVSDYLKVAGHNGSWSDIDALTNDHDLVFDYVINHGSSQHPRFKEFLDDRPPGNQYFITADPETDVSKVTRPRASSLLQEYQTAKGVQFVWCTFSRDQVDWNFANPEVLYDFVEVFIQYIEHGARWLRIDAIAYLWKQLGTNCVHLPQTHGVVKVLRAVADAISPTIKLLTETNVPQDENLSYFGDGDEAHIVYNFSLPPLLTHTLLSGDSGHLTRWCRSLPALPPGCTLLNFTASHDGVGLRPAEGILSERETKNLVNCLRSFGGLVTERRRPDGSLSPYEANISMFDAFKGTVAGIDSLQTERFLLSQCLMLALKGVPALYYNSLLATPNNLEGLKATGRNRTINRRKWTLTEVSERLDPVDGQPRRVLDGLRTMLNVRRQQTAFHPESEQVCLDLDTQLFAIKRTAANSGQCLICVFNVSDKSTQVPVADLGVVKLSERRAVYRTGDLRFDRETLGMGPYAAIWYEI
ncbi:MAG: sugar phosphorylase [Myxococcota bacterium]|nr:sugar phosphorylase [Myxococcota bacterium]